MPKFEINDIIHRTGKDSTKTKYLVVGFDNGVYTIKAITGSFKNNEFYLHINGIDYPHFEKIAHFTPKTKKAKNKPIKPNCYVEITDGTSNQLIGKKAIFMCNLSPEILVDGVKCDCCIKLVESNRMICYKTNWIKRIPKANKPQRGVYEKAEASVPCFVIRRLGNNKTIVEKVTDCDCQNNEIVIKGKETFETRCHKKDKYDEKVGVLIALARAYNDKELEEYAVNYLKYNSWINAIKEIKA